MLLPDFSSPAGRALHGFMFGHRGHRPREVVSGLEAHRQGQFAASSDSMPDTPAALFSRTGSGRSHPCTAQDVRTMR
jgi:hypothetical protein